MYLLLFALINLLGDFLKKFAVFKIVFSRFLFQIKSMGYIRFKTPRLGTAAYSTDKLLKGV